MVILSTVAHICKRYKQCLKCNKHFSKHNTVLSAPNTVLSKYNTMPSKHNTVLSKHNTIYGNTIQYLQTQRKSSKTQLYICETQHKIFRYVMQDVNTIRIINPPLLNRWHALHFPAILVRHFAWKNCFVLAVEPVWKLFQKAESDSSESETDKGAAKYSSFKNYAAQESEVRSTHFRSSGSKGRGQKKKEEDPFVLINIDLMQFIGPDVPTPIRGKTFSTPDHQLPFQQR